MVKQRASNMSEDENDGIRILGFTEHEVELVLMSVQCIKGSKRFMVGWEVSSAANLPVLEECNPAHKSIDSQVGMKDFANLTNTSITDARAKWRDLSSRLMKLPRLPSKSPSLSPRDESEGSIEDCIIVRDEMDKSSSGECDEEGECKTKRKTRSRKKGKQVAKPSVLDSIEAEVDSEDNVGATDEGRSKSDDDGILEPPANEDRTKQAWAEIGDDMTEEKWNEMGDELAL